MAKEILEQLFGSSVRVKLFKLFLRNPDSCFTFTETVRRVKSNKSVCRKELKKLEDVGFVDVKIKANKKTYCVNQGFDFFRELKTLILKSSPASQKKIIKRIKTVGSIKLMIISGILTNTENARVDLFIVGDNLHSKKFNNFLIDLEADVGKEIDYVILNTDEFKYRFQMFDRFILDILEKPHKKLINKLNIAD